MRSSIALIFLLAVPVAFGVFATLASRPYKVGSTSGTEGPPCMIQTDTTWYGYPIPWFYTSDSKVLGNCFGPALYPISGVAVAAFLLDVLIYMAVYYAPILAYVGIRRAVFTRMRLGSGARKLGEDSSSF